MKITLMKTSFKKIYVSTNISEYEVNMQTVSKEDKKNSTQKSWESWAYMCTSMLILARLQYPNVEKKYRFQLPHMEYNFLCQECIFDFTI